MSNPIGWSHVYDDTNVKAPVLHVVPVDDLYIHDTKDCWCKPFDDGEYIVHNSADHREDYIECGRKMN